MPRYISKLGKWAPVKEYFVNPDAEPGTNPVYEGPDRGALEQLKELGMIDENGNIIDTPGLEPHQNTDLLLKARQFGFDNVYDYLSKIHGIDKDKALKMADEELKKIRTHKDNMNRVNPIKELGGGRDYSGQGKHRAGGMGDPDDVSAAALKQRT